ncbi:MAG: OmpA family protein [Bacteroides sp.]|nr:OmpA family protein [Bacteroides sp.]MCM1414265.1 OmpA family protein [Bacteroides sp.]
MKKLFLIALAASSMVAAQAQVKAFEPVSFWDNWSIGLDGGVTTPLAKHHAFFGDMRGTFGLHIQKQVSPVVAIGVEGALGVNTSSWNNKYFEDTYGDYILPGRSTTSFDNSYVGAYAAFNLFNLFGGYNCDGRLFDMELVAGAGWGHDFYNSSALYPMTYEAEDQNYFATKVGLNFNFNVTENWTISLKPSVNFNMTGTAYQPLDVDQTSAAYSRSKAVFNLMAGVTYNFGPGFVCADTQNQAEIDALNAQINDLRGQIDACLAATAANQAAAAATAAELEACKNRKPTVVEKVNDNLQSVRYVFYKIGSSKITADQQPNVEMVASYLKNHKDSKVVVKGYASQDGNLEFNKKLAAARAESVKTMLIKKYGIAADRITAEGEGIGHMFTENDWNRVSICTLEN